MSLDSYLLPYQRLFAADDRRFKIWLAARQVGKSTAVAYEAVFQASSRPRTAILLVSASQRQSLELLEKVRFWVSLARAGVDDGVTIRENAEELRLINQSRIVSLPANPDTIRGFSGHIFLDEFAFHRDSRRIWAAVFPIVTRGYRIRIISTPNGQQNLFHEIWSRGGDLWSRHRTTIIEAQAQGLNVDLEALRAGTPDPETWAQEYECRFLDQATAYLPFELIDAAEHPEAGRPELAASGPCFIGVDLARRRDLSVWWVLEAVGDVLWTREVVTARDSSFSDQDATLDALVRRYQAQRVCLDQSGMGERVVEEARSRWGRSRIEGIIFTPAGKQDLATALRRRFEDRTIRIPRDPGVRDDLHAVRRVVTSAGNPRFDAERTSHGHADRFWALGLAIHAASRPAALPTVSSRHSRSSGSLGKGF